MKEWTVYLSGEIHSEWRQEIINKCKETSLPILFTNPNTNHENSDNCGVNILGDEDKPFWKDHKGAKLNTIRHQTLIKQADIVVVRFGDQYKQWNAAFDAGYASALGKPLIINHAPELTHPLKEVDAVALAVAETPKQVAEVLYYIINGKFL